MIGKIVPAWKVWVVSCVAAMCSVQCVPCALCAAHEVLKVGGTGGALAAMRLLSIPFEEAYPGADVRVLASMGSTAGIRAVSRGAIEIGLSSRPFKDEERSLGLEIRAYAKTPFVVVTHRDVGVKKMSTDDLVKILSGEMTKWPSGKRIRLILRPESDTDTEYLRRISPRVASALTKAFSRPGMKIAITDQECLDMVEKTPGAVGFSGLAQVVSEKRRVSVLDYDSESARVKGRVNGSYRFMKQFSMVTKAHPSAMVERFVAFVFSDKGRKILEKTGNIPVKVPGD